MKLSKHAAIRSDQRGIRPEVIPMILEYGEPMNGRDGATEYFFGKRARANVTVELKRWLRVFEGAAGVSLLVKDDTVLTAFKRPKSRATPRCRRNEAAREQ